VEDEWKDRHGNTHQRTTKGRLFWLNRANTLYFFSGDRVFTLTENNRIEELKP
jgi:hypothetical protein